MVRTASAVQGVGAWRGMACLQAFDGSIVVNSHRANRCRD